MVGHVFETNIFEILFLVLNFFNPAFRNFWVILKVTE